MDISSVAMVFERRHAVLLPAHDYGSMAIATGQLAAVGLWYILLRRRFNGKASRTRDGDNETD